MSHLVTVWNAGILGLVEGATEFLPISSTGHLIIGKNALGFDYEKWKTFIIVIQVGAILAVCWEYRVRLWRAVVGLQRERAARRFWINLGVAFLPAAVIGVLCGDYIDRVLFAPLPVAMTSILGAFIIFWVEKRRPPVRIEATDAITWKDALKIGCAQVAALIPGTSRSGATIIGGMIFGLSRPAATEFSFFLAIPVIFAASAYKLLTERDSFTAGDVEIFGLGLVVSFVSALIVVKWLIRYVAQHDFRIFAWYRLGLGLLLILVFWR